MAERASLPVEAFSDPDAYWSSLSDEQLAEVVWTTADPLKLDGLREAIPVELPSFIIELSYELDRQHDAPVPCAHCPKHQKHWRGYVLLTVTGERYLLGSDCGPRAYGADYAVASKNRKTALRRTEAASSWKQLGPVLETAITVLATTVRGDAFKALRRIRQTWEKRAPRTLRELRTAPLDSLTGAPRLSASRSYRDTAAEARRDTRYLTEVQALANLPSKQHRLAVAALKEQLGTGPIMVKEDLDWGVLRGADWLLPEADPLAPLEGIVSRLRAYLAVGQTTQDKTVARLGQFVREARRDLERADKLLEMIAAAPRFFSPEMLAALSEWYAAAPYRRGHVRAEGSALYVCDEYMEEIGLRLPMGWTVPGPVSRGPGGSGRA